MLAEMFRDRGERLDQLGLRGDLRDEFGYQGLFIEILNKDLHTLIVSNGYQGRVIASIARIYGCITNYP